MSSYLTRDFAALINLRPLRERDYPTLFSRWTQSLESLKVKEDESALVAQRVKDRVLSPQEMESMPWPGFNPRPGTSASLGTQPPPKIKKSLGPTSSRR